jgi:hypothetical protein
VQAAGETPPFCFFAAVSPGPWGTMAVPIRLIVAANTIEGRQAPFKR